VSTKLYVGSLPYSTTDAELTELFAQHGSVTTAQVIMDKITGRSRGFGFVQMANQEDARRAVEALNGTKLEQRTLVVDEARPQPKRERAASRW
jgi:RNA recognition motif-containing protein